LTTEKPAAVSPHAQVHGRRTPTRRAAPRDVSSRAAHVRRWKVYLPVGSRVMV
jgi:hypothetical protein